jgi:FkbM family methyltransferase
MKAKPYHLQISAKTRSLNFLRKFFIISGLDKFLAKYARNNKRNVFAAKLIPPNYLYQPGTIRTCNVDGINFKLDISDTVGHTNYYSIGDQAEQLLFDFVKPGMIVVDIGANIAATTLNLAKRTLPGGKIFSFEPSPYNYQRASENISLNNFSNIRLINQGLGNEKTTAFLYNVNSHNSGMQRILNNDEGAFSYEKTAVEIDTLDSSMQKFEIPKPSLIKIDVEGYELKVLKGGKETIMKYRPALFIELDDDNLHEQGNNAKELIQSLIQLQYKIINAATGSCVDENTNYTNCHFDILCTPA